MAAAKTYFWNHAGVFIFGGKEYSFGQALPAKVPADTIKSLLKKKRIAEKKPEGPAVIGSVVERFQKQIDDLTAERDELVSKLEDTGGDEAYQRVSEKLLDAEKSVIELTAERDELTGKLEDAEKTIADLTQQITAPKGGK